MMRVFRSLVRIGAFVNKEMLEVLRQPRLVLLLVLGPFAILALFGVGYLGTPISYRTLFVVEPGSDLAGQIPKYAASISPQLLYTGMTGDQEQALAALKRNEVDLVIVAPADVAQTLRSNRQATFTLYHNQIDPMQANYVQYFGNIIVQWVNRRVLEAAAAQGQAGSGDAQAEIESAQESAAAMRVAVQAGDAVMAREKQQRLAESLDRLSLALAVGGNSLEQSDAADEEQLDQATRALAALRQETAALASALTNNTPASQQVERLTAIERRLAELQETLAGFRSLSPNVLVSPFAADTRSVAPGQPTMVRYYVPAVLALLLQHLAITLAALSIVREQQLGAMELFRVSPVSAAETLVGKYLSYMIFQVILAAILTALSIYGLGMAMLGDWWDYALVVAAVSFGSLGYGFVISLLSQTDSQAVQLTMLVLLVSVFFSGFFMNLNYLADWLHVLSWALPVTYGIDMLRNIMLRGIMGPWTEIAVLIGIGAALALVAWVLLKRRMARA
jgi:ABC-2 type transport system permease protein